MPNRILRDGIITSEAVNKLSPAAEVFYRRLMSVVDDYGRYTAHPTLLKAALFPLQLSRVSETDIEEWLRQCVDLIQLYSEEGKDYLAILNFGQRTRTPSKFPAPAECQHAARKARARREHPAAHARGRSESESESESESNAKTEAALSRGVENAADPAPTNTNGFAEEFDQFHEFRSAGESIGISGSEPDWQEARREWRRLDFAQKMAAVDGYRAREGLSDDPGVKALPQNYLRRRIWERQVRAPTQSGRGSAWANAR
jgi:hypothetical protein